MVDRIGPRPFGKCVCRSSSYAPSHAIGPRKLQSMGPPKQSSGRPMLETLPLVPLGRQVLLPGSAARVSLASWESRFADHAPLHLYDTCTRTFDRASRLLYCSSIDHGVLRMYRLACSDLVQHLLDAGGGDLLVVAVPLASGHDAAADELTDSNGSRSAAGDGGDERGSQAQSGPDKVAASVSKLDLSRLHARGTIARVRQLTRLSEVRPHLHLSILPATAAHQYNKCRHPRR